MKKVFFLAVVFLLAFMSISPASARTMAQNLKGKILLQVEEHGEAWYVNPTDNYRYFLGRPADAFQIMRNLGLGISEADYKRFNGTAPASLSGKILLRVQSHGEAYYVNPTNLKMNYLGRPSDAFRVMRELGLGITNTNLNKITMKGGQNGTVSAKISFDLTDDGITSIVQTGSTAVTDETFENNFAKCIPASTLRELPGMGVSYLYEIIGPEAGKCKIRTHYPTNPNPEWLDKEMTCLYDNTKSFDTATGDIFGQVRYTCVGPLATLLFSERREGTE